MKMHAWNRYITQFWPRDLSYSQVNQYPMWMLGKIAWLYVMFRHQQYYNKKSKAQCPACFFSLKFSFWFCYLLSHHLLFCFSAWLSARACLCHISGGLRVMPWSGCKLGHCSMYAVKYPVQETASLSHFVLLNGNEGKTGDCNKMVVFHWPLFALKSASPSARAAWM